MSLANPTIDEQIAINASNWFAASASGKTYLHDQNVALQAQKDAQNQTKTTYNPQKGNYQTSAVVPVQIVVDQPYIPTVTSYPVQATSYSNSSVSQSAPQQTAEQKRSAEAAAFTGWDNEPTLRAMQVKSWDLYIASGNWNSPEQIKIHNDSEALRKSINITYGGAAWGTPNKGAADDLILPDNTPNVTGVSNAITGAFKGLITGVAGTSSDKASGILKLGMGAGALLLVMSLFKGR